jgi:hypothetical protein
MSRTGVTSALCARARDLTDRETKLLANALQTVWLLSHHRCVAVKVSTNPWFSGWVPEQSEYPEGEQYAYSSRCAELMVTDRPF